MSIMDKTPTGIDSFDSLIQGGMPPGSLVLLLEEIGAGGFEFAITSAASLLKNLDETPLEKICYISITRKAEDILQEIAHSFPPYHEVIQQHIDTGRFEVKEFIQMYFATSLIPISWITPSKANFNTLAQENEEKRLIHALIKYLEKNANSSLIIIDSLTNLIQYSLEHVNWRDLILLLQGLQCASKKWKGMIYALLCRDVFEHSREVEIAECMDTVLSFKWAEDTTRRQRLMYINKGRGILPTLDQDNIVNFETQITPKRGFEIGNVKRIKGRI